MAIETEIKIALPRLGDFRNKLACLAPAGASERHFEDNFILDYPDGRLRSEACLLRVRKTDGRESVTYKGPPAPSELFKSREEIETTVGDGEQALEIFSRLGLVVWFRYQKYREEFSLAAGPGSQEILHIALDETPIGDYAEIEGSEEGIRAVAARLGISEKEFLRQSYHTLYEEFCRRHGTAPGHMIFPAPGGSGSVQG